MKQNILKVVPNMRQNILKIISLIITSAAIGFYLGTQDYTTKVTQKEQNRSKQDIKVVEKIVIKPGGEKIIYRTRREKRSDNQKKTYEKVVKAPKWLIGLSYSPGGVFGVRQTYTLSLDRKVLGGAYMGLYGTSTGEFGLGLRYSF